MAESARRAFLRERSHHRAAEPFHLMWLLRASLYEMIRGNRSLVIPWGETDKCLGVLSVAAYCVNWCNRKGGSTLNPLRWGTSCRRQNISTLTSIFNPWNRAPALTVMASHLFTEPEERPLTPPHRGWCLASGWEPLTQPVPTTINRINLTSVYTCGKNDPINTEDDELVIYSSVLEPLTIRARVNPSLSRRPAGTEKAVGSNKGCRQSLQCSPTMVLPPDPLASLYQARCLWHSPQRLWKNGCW